jgi:hypothetical protein
MLSTPSRPENETAGNELTHLGIGVAGMLPRIDASEPGCPPRPLRVAAVGSIGLDKSLPLIRPITFRSGLVQPLGGRSSSNHLGQKF